MSIDVRQLTPKQLLIMWEELRYMPHESPKTRAELESELVHRKVRPITDHSDTEPVEDSVTIVADTAFFVNHSLSPLKPRKRRKTKRKVCKKNSR